ncbi:hypothetical protein QVD17_34167 [Tagetes erecta]|uniref:Uncharacterized protein n=1 Tax=Tagetes erecta TaxID=13708 RepID=A0AAD8K408_TARER|nr:hypothetical protein QVD17_34167 [Tagetes erecta]
MEGGQYKFGPHMIDQRDVFYTTELSYAFVNLRPVLPADCGVAAACHGGIADCGQGHREVKRFVDLTNEETIDLWISVKKIAKQLENYHKASSLTFTIQIDEKEKELKKKLDLDKERKDRNMEERAQEAAEYRKLSF